MTDTFEIMISAGEASGDQHGANVLQYLLEKHSQLHVFGMGGPALEKAGLEIIIDCREVSVIGITEALIKYIPLKKSLNTLQKTLKQRQPKLLITIDFPDFNFKLADTAKALDIPVLHYISPKVWAWRPKRIKRIGQCVDHMALIFPFEKSIYKQAKIPATYVGNPLKDQIHISTTRNDFFTEYHLCENQKLIALIPGSRRSEINRLLPDMLKAAAEINKQDQNIQFILPQAPTIKDELIESLLDNNPLGITVIKQRTHDVMAHSDVLLIASGTATLEAAVIGTPMCVIYRIGNVSYQLLKRLIQIPYVSLVNIVAEKQVVKELLQEQVTPKNMAKEVNTLLHDAKYRHQMKQSLTEINKKLGEPGASKRLGKLVEQMAGISD